MPNRPYQNDLIYTTQRQIARGNTRLILVSPTGSGKTRVSSKLLDKSRHRKMLYIVPAEEIMEQISADLNELGIRHAKLSAGKHLKLGKRSQTRCVVAMSHTLARRLPEGEFDLWDPDIIFIDEIHKLYAQHKTVIDAFPRSIVIGMTATPVRLDGKSLANLASNMIIGPSVQHLIRNRWLVPPICYQCEHPDLSAVKKNKWGEHDDNDMGNAYIRQGIIGVIPKHLSEKARNRRTMLFAPSVNASQAIAEECKKYGLRFVHLDGSTPKDVRDAALKALDKKEIDGVTNVGLFIEGLDVRSIDCVAIVRDTQSLAAYLQMVGRGLRISPETSKRDLIVLDFGTNVMRMGRPDADRDWPNGGAALGGGQRSCKVCRCMFAYDRDYCPQCGYHPVKSRVSPNRQRAFAQRMSRRTPPRKCPPWARDVSELWYESERIRHRKGYELPDKASKRTGFSEKRCLREIRKRGKHA